jgi:hypothetical protein
MTADLQHPHAILDGGRKIENVFEGASVNNSTIPSREIIGDGAIQVMNDRCPLIPACIDRFDRLSPENLENPV